MEKKNIELGKKVLPSELLIRMRDVPLGLLIDFCESLNCIAVIENGELISIYGVR